MPNPTSSITRDIRKVPRREWKDHEIDLNETLVGSLTDKEQMSVVSLVCDNKTARVTFKDGRTWTLTNGDDGWHADKQPA